MYDYMIELTILIKYEKERESYEEITGNGINW